MRFTSRSGLQTAFDAAGKWAACVYRFRLDDAGYRNSKPRLQRVFDESFVAPNAARNLPKYGTLNSRFFISGFYALVFSQRMSDIHCYRDHVAAHRRLPDAPYMELPQISAVVVDWFTTPTGEFDEADVVFR